MSDSAERFNPETGEWNLVHAANLDNSDRTDQYRCVSCHAPSTLAICLEKENYFLSKEHSIDCPEAKGHKLIRLKSRTEIDLDAILNYEDHDPPVKKHTPPGEKAGGSGLESEPPDDPDTDLRVDPNATYTIRSASGMYRELIERHGSDFIDSIAAKEVDSIFLRRDTFQKFKSDWGNPMKLVVTKRCFPQKLKYNIPIPEGYVILRDAYSHNDEDAIYFMVRMCHPEHDKKFKGRLFGHTEKDEAGNVIKGVGKDPRRNIVIFAHWSKVPHSHYQIYRTELNSRMVVFANVFDAN